jgi:ATP/maltotriose-dependent transcriptional regulator MalT
LLFLLDGSIIASTKSMTTQPHTRAFIRTKLYRPPLPPDWVPCPQLLDRLHQQRERPLTLVSAPAGFGKSALSVALIVKSVRQPP